MGIDSEDGVGVLDHCGRMSGIWVYWLIFMVFWLQSSRAIILSDQSLD